MATVVSGMVLKPHISIVKPLADGRLGLCKILCFSIFFLSIATAQEKLPAGQGREVIKKVCSKCHSAENVIGLAKSREEWGELVGKMVDIGAQGTVDDF